MTLVVLAAPLLALVSFGAGCAPEPRNVPCSNDAQCEKASPDFRFCVESRCVECLGASSCGEGGACVDGRCVTPCGADGRCPTNHTCKNGSCTPG